MTATDAGAIPEPVRTRLEVIQLPAYSEQDKLAIAQRYLLTRRFGEPRHTVTGCLVPEPAAPPNAAEPDTARDGPVVVVDREVSSVRELEALLAGPAAAGRRRDEAGAGVHGRRPLRAGDDPPGGFRTTRMKRAWRTCTRSWRRSAGR